MGRQRLILEEYTERVLGRLGEVEGMCKVAEGHPELPLSVVARVSRAGKEESSRVMDEFRANLALLQHVFPHSSGRPKDADGGRGSEEGAYFSVDRVLDGVWRDWSEDGWREIGCVAYSMLLSSLPPSLLGSSEDSSSTEGKSKRRVLVPGAGTCRLAHMVADAVDGGVEVVAVDTSGPMLDVYDAMVGQRGDAVDGTIFYPGSEGREGVKIKAGGDRPCNLELVCGSFGRPMWEDPDEAVRYDVVVTCAVIDAIPEGPLEVAMGVAKMLKPGGVWLSLGPLAYHDAVRGNPDALCLDWDTLAGVLGDDEWCEMTQTRLIRAHLVPGLSYLPGASRVYDMGFLQVEKRRTTTVR